MTQAFNGLAYENGELLRTDIHTDDGYVGVWMSDALRDDVEDVEDLGSVLFFDDIQHFAGWVLGKLDAKTAEEVWPDDSQV